MKNKIKKPQTTQVGELRLHRDGYGFVLADRPNGEDLFIPARFVGDAMHTDMVEARALAGRGGKLEGRITRIIKRNVKKLMGRLERFGDKYQVVADDRRVRHRVIVMRNKIGGAKHSDNVIVKILRHPEGETPMLGEVETVLGRRGEEDTEKTAVIVRHQLVCGFSTVVLREAENLRKLMDDSQENRVDLRGIPFVTIDGETAKDFDDAVAVKKAEDGKIRLWVSIADVSFFVRPHTALDKTAYERATSVYFPGDCIPMLPEELSNDLCSLVPKEDRFTMTAEMDVAPDGRIVRRKFYRSVIKSRERMTYTNVKKTLVDRDEEMLSRYRELLPEFLLMEECYKRLRSRRKALGSIDFDLPEPEIETNLQGDISNIVRAERHVGHMMIEDFMIAANESVAEFLTEKKLGCMYRVHEPPPPDKLHEFSILMSNLGHKISIGRDAKSGTLAKVVEIVHGRPEERLVNHTLLRSMSQAVYSSHNKGHFGLASKCYCHFTSPIRRYPDLVVHRLLSTALGSGSRVSGFGSRIQEMAEHCSGRERVAMDAEREIEKLYSAIFMQEKVGESFDGIISHVGKFGFFVELIEYFVEGIVLIAALDDDHYTFEESGSRLVGRRKKKIFRIGDRVRIEVAEVDVPNREIVFELNYQL